jgi:hypothetical protein
MTHRINLSAGWAFDGTRWVRRFGRPTGIDGATLRLVADFPAEAVLNGELLGDAWPLDVTGKLLLRNELALACGAVGAVALEIEHADDV